MNQFHDPSVWLQRIDQQGYTYWVNSVTGQVTYHLHGGGVAGSPHHLIDYSAHHAPPMMGTSPPGTGLVYHPANVAGFGGSTGGSMFGNGKDAARMAINVASTVGLGLLVASTATQAAPFSSKARLRLSRKVHRMKTFGSPSHF